MRHVFALLAVGPLLAIACGGEVTGTPGASTTEPQTAEGSGTPGPGATAASSTDADAGAAAPPSTSTSCWVLDGPPAPGECVVGEERACPSDLDAGPSSSGGYPSGFCQQRCVNVNGTATWSEPTHNGECAYYDTNLFIGQGNPSCMCNTPLVLSFDDRAVVFRADAKGSFDLSRLGISHGSDWPGADTPWLALDRNGNGAIDDGGELFGSATRLAGGSRGFARNGFEALRDLDANRDGVFDGRDPAFARVLVWSDANRDKQSSPDELTTLADRGVTSISLRDRNEPRCDARGNCEGERAPFTFGAGKHGTVIDVYLPSR